jgi:hypothetical protein
MWLVGRNRFFIEPAEKRVRELAIEKAKRLERP